MTGKYHSLIQDNNYEFVKCSVLENIANELAESNRLKRLELKYVLRGDCDGGIIDAYSNEELGDQA